MPSNTSRRGFLALCGTASLAGCTAPTLSEPDDVVAGVEWKSMRGVRDDRSVNVLDNQPTETVEHRAPVDLALRTHVLDDAVADHGVDVPETGSLRVTDAMAGAFADIYDERSYSLVLTLYERERVAGVPLGNSFGYRVPREAFNRVDPGDRIVIRAGERDGVSWITELVAVTSA